MCSSAFRPHTDLNGLKPSVACKIFDSMISPILTYNSEVWGAFVKSDFKSWDSSSAIEKIHLHFCKRYLQVHNKASNIACRAELGKFPMIIDINKDMLNYLGYLISKDEDSIVKQALQISIDLYHNGKISFYSNLMKMVDYYDLNYDFSCNSLSDSTVNRYIGIMKNKYVSYKESDPSTITKTQLTTIAHRRT